MSKLLPIDISCQIVEEIGQRKLASVCAVTPGGVNHWKSRGLPKYRAAYLRLRYPKLQVWKQLPKEL